MTAKCKVTVIVPAYNAEALIGPCLSSLLNQTYPSCSYEVIVVDNGSSDDTASVVNEYPVELLFERNRQSSYAARNLGIEAAKGDMVLFTDADCRPKNDWIERIIAAFDDKSVAGVGGQIIDAPATNEIDRFIGELNPLNNARMLNDTYHVSIVTANAAYRKRVLESVDGFDDSMTTGGDIDLAWRIQRQQLGRIVYVAEAQVIHQHRSTLKGMYRMFQRYGYCSAIMSGRYQDDKSYPQTPSWQVRKTLRQLRALGTYLLSFVNRVVIKSGQSPYERRKPLYYFVAEAGNLGGRIRGIIETRFYRKNTNSNSEKLT